VVGRPLRIGRSADRVTADFGAVWGTSAADGDVTGVEPAPAPD
jgi:hypothetical protein